MSGYRQDDVHARVPKVRGQGIGLCSGSRLELRVILVAGPELRHVRDDWDGWRAQRAGAGVREVQNLWGRRAQKR